jgi:predicted DNA-binding protein with PD1-like motif
VEVFSLIGNIALDQGEPKVHSSVITGKSDGTAHGRRLWKAHISPTLEAIVVESAGEIHKSYDPASRPDLITLDK